jgi:hypothetical protein
MKMATLVYMESTEYSVTKSILKGHLSGKSYAAAESNQVTGSVRYIPHKKLFNHNLQVRQQVYSIYISDLRSLAFQIAEFNNFLDVFDKDKEIVERERRSGFTGGYQYLSLR